VAEAEVMAEEAAEVVAMVAEAVAEAAPQRHPIAPQPPLLPPQQRVKWRRLRQSTGG